VSSTRDGAAKAPLLYEVTSHETKTEVEMSFSQDHLKLSSTVHVARSGLSPSTMLTMLSCPGRYAADRTITQPEDPFGAAELGTSTHAMMEALLAKAPAERSVAHAKALLGATEAPVGADKQTWSDAVWERASGLWQITDPARLSPLATEVLLEATIDDVPMRGIIDLVDHHAGGIRIVDYKTGKPAKPQSRWPGYPDQVRVYALLWEASYGEAPGRGELWYTRAGVAHEVDVSAKARAGTLGLAKTAWAELTRSVAAGAFATKASPLCQWCPACAVCPTAAAAGWSPIAAASPVTAKGGPTPTYSLTRPAAVGHGSDDRRPDMSYQPTTSALMVDESQPWKPFTDTGAPNLASYQAVNARRLVMTAMGIAQSSGQALTPKAVQSYASLLVKMVYTAQTNLGRKASLQSALASHLVSMLDTTVRDVPPPRLDDPPELMTAWALAMTRRVTKMCSIMISLMDTGPGLGLVTEPSSGHDQAEAGAGPADEAMAVA